jgi:hypothetical protein
MTKNLINYYSDSGDGAPSPLSELRYGAEPAMVLLFTADCQETSLHYVDDEAVRSYIKCPGAGCPICYTGAAPARFDLLPVFDVESAIVKVLRISDNRRPEGLAAKLIPHLKDPHSADKLVLISRRRMADYRVESRQIGPDAKRGEAEIKAFGEHLEQGLQMDAAFQAMTHIELAGVPKIAARLAALGGWNPPGPGEGESGAGDAS